MTPQLDLRNLLLLSGVYAGMSGVTVFERHLNIRTALPGVGIVCGIKLGRIMRGED
jgi:hypothetical protein